MLLVIMPSLLRLYIYAFRVPILKHWLKMTKFLIQQPFYALAESLNFHLLHPLSSSLTCRLRLSSSLILAAVDKHRYSMTLVTYYRRSLVTLRCNQ
jgi:hypothetical protein